MGKEIVYCHVCGSRIVESEFDKGRAVTLLKRAYCSKCATPAVIAEAAKKDAPAEARADRPPTTRRHSDTTHIPTRLRRDSRKRRRRSRVGLVVAAVVLGVLVVLVIVWLAVRG